MIVQKSPQGSDDLSSTEIMNFIKKLDTNILYVTSFEEIHKATKSTSREDPELIILDLRNAIRHLIQVSIDQMSAVKYSMLIMLDPSQLHNVEATGDLTDFIVSPVTGAELGFRIRKLTVDPKSKSTDNFIIVDDLKINPANYDVTILGKRIDLRFKEYELLLLLASNPGRVYDRATLLNQIWGYDYFGGTRTVDVHIRRLRSKIEAESEKNFIETIWNVGYRFKAI